MESGPDPIAVPAELVRVDRGLLKLRFTPRSLQDEGAIARAVLGRADAWLGWDVHRQDRPLRALAEVVYCSLSAFTAGMRQGVRVSKAATPVVGARTPAAAQPDRRTEVLRPRPAMTAAAITLCAGLALPGAAALAQPARQQPPPAGGSAAAPPRTAAPAPAATAVPAASPAQATIPVIPPPAPEAPAGPGVRHLSITLRDLGQRGPMQLRGGLDQRNPTFGLRGDEVVTAAKLVAAGAMSPGLIPELSQFAFTMNDQFVGALQPDRTRPAFGPVEMPVNPAFFADTNRLGIRFTGSYTRECQDPGHGLLWATLSDLTALHLTVERLPPGRDLGRLPEPFFDPRITHEPLTLPMVLPEAAGGDALRAAAIAASWFAVQADYRGAAFPVAPSPPPLGHALLIAAGNDQPAPAGVALPRFEGPTLAILPNPNDPFGLLLVVGGRTAAEAVTAATALAVGGGAPLAGEIALVQAVHPRPRRPYDAPRWIPSDRPVRLGEMVDLSELQAEGYGPAPIRVPFRTAPDLYAWRNRPLAIDLRYRAPPGPVLDLAVSRLDVSVSGIFLKSLTLGRPDPSWPWSLLRPWFAEDDRVLQGRAGLPAWTVSGQNELQIRYDMRPLNRGECVAVPAEIRAGIEPDSTIDLSNARRFAPLPNLAFFTGAGFPFTRLADLSETTAVLPDRPSAVEVSALLGLVGRASAIVGHPATGLQVARGDAGLEASRDRDLIVVGALGNRFPALDRLLQGAAGGKGAPVRLEGTRLAVALPDPMASIRELFPFGGASDAGERSRAAARLSQPAEGLGVLVGFESPLRAGRSVVALTGGAPAGLEAMLAALRDPDQVGQVQGDLAIVAAGRVSSYRTGPIYSHGELPIWLWPQYYMGGQPLLLLAGLGASSLLMGMPMYWALRRRAARRLRGK
jgi:cellulose synthase (UDP-forming)